MKTENTFKHSTKLTTIIINDQFPKLDTDVSVYNLISHVFGIAKEEVPYEFSITNELIRAAHGVKLFVELTINFNDEMDLIQFKLLETSIPRYIEF